jgi:hypothetical protein
MGDEKNPILYLPNSPYNMTTQSISDSFYVWDTQPSQSSSNYTIVSYAWQSDPNFPLVYSDLIMDFQVEAIVGHDSQKWVVEHPLFPSDQGYYEPAIAYDTDSGWSNTQTINLADGSTSIYTSPNPSPTVPEFPITASLVAVLAAANLLLVIGKRKQSRNYITQEELR